MEVKAKNDIIPLSLDDYKEYTAKVVDHIFESKQVCAIYQLGGWSQPGISDIDLIVVTKEDSDDFLDLSKRNLCVDSKQSYMLMHPPFVIPRNVFKFLDVFFYCSDLRLIKGEEIKIETLEEGFKIDVEYFKTLAFLLHTFPRFNGFDNIISLRSFLTFSYSLKHTYKILKDLNSEYKNNFIEDYISEIIKFRKSALEIKDGQELIDVTKLVGDGKKVCSSMMEELKNQMLNVYNINFLLAKDIFYLKNHLNIFHFSEDTKISSKQEQMINITTLPMVFAVFVLLPIDNSIKFSAYQANNIYGNPNIKITPNLESNLKKIKKLYDVYQKSYKKSKVINGMPLELNTTMIWQPKLLESFDLKLNYGALKNKIKLWQTKKIIKNISEGF